MELEDPSRSSELQLQVILTQRDAEHVHVRVESWSLKSGLKLEWFKLFSGSEIRELAHWWTSSCGHGAALAPELQLLDVFRRATLALLCASVINDCICANNIQHCRSSFDHCTVLDYFESI